MSNPVISVEHLSKTYRLGQIGTGRFRQVQPDAFTNDLKLWRAKVPGKPNSLSRIGETDPGDRNCDRLGSVIFNRVE